MIAGTSTGAIIALALASGFPAESVLKLYLERGGEIFPRRRAFGILGPAFSPGALTHHLKTMFGQRLFGDVCTRLCVPSADGRHGDVAVFKTPHHPDFKCDWKMSVCDVALASSAAPTFLPVHAVGGYRFVDGGVWANNPVMVGIVDVLSCFDISPRQIQVLSIGSGATRPILGAGPLNFGGVFGWLHGGALIDSMMYYSSQNADGQAGLLIGRDRLLRLEPDSVEPDIHMTDFATAKAVLPLKAREVFDARKGDLLGMLDIECGPARFFHGPRAVHE